jgi:membrane-associated phospholipid phosphatase
MTVLSLLVASSTVFVKQHAILDLAAGALLGILAVLAAFALFRRKGAGKEARSGA